MRLLRPFLVLLFLVLPQLALAHGPTRQKTALSVDVAAEPADVWAVIGNFQDMSWHPAVFSSTSDGGIAIDATRVLTLGQEGGPTISEVLYKYDAEKMSYSYRITGVEVEVLPVPGNPAGLAVADTLGAVFVVSLETKTVSRFSLKDNSLTGLLALDGGPIGIAVDAQRRRLFVLDWLNARAWVVDADSLTITAMLDTGAAPAGLALSPDGRLLVTADRDAKRLSVFDAETLAPLRRIGVGTRPFGVSFAPDGRVFSADVGSNTVTVADPQTATVLGHVKTGERPYDIAFARGKRSVTNQYAYSVTVFDAATLAPIAVIDVGEYSEGIDTWTDGMRVYVANWFSNTLSVIDADTHVVTGEVETGDGPRAFGQFIAATEGTSPCVCC